MYVNASILVVMIYPNFKMIETTATLHIFIYLLAFKLSSKHHMLWAWPKGNPKLAVINLTNIG